MQQHLVNWVEIPVVDLARAQKFYEQVFEFEMQRMQMDGEQYAVFPVEDRFNCGALVQGPKRKVCADGFALYLDGGPDMGQILARVPAAGGRVTMGKTYTGEMAGYVGGFVDSEGNHIGLQHM